MKGRKCYRGLLNLKAQGSRRQTLSRDMEDSLARLLGALYEGHKLATEGVVTRQVEGIQRSRVTRGGCTEGCSTRNSEVQETGIVGNQVTILIDHTHRHEGYIPSVRRKCRTVGYELEVMGLTCGADNLLLGNASDE